MNVSLRPFTPEDQEFVFQLYTGSRRQEVSAWGWNQEQQDAFLRMQFVAQQRWYEMVYANAQHQIIQSESQPIGRMIVMRSSGCIVLVDIVLLEQYRGRGIGGRLLADLLKQSDQDRLPVQLRVLKSNPARRLYERLGFVQTEEDGMYVQMDRMPR